MAIEKEGRKVEAKTYKGGVQGFKTPGTNAAYKAMNKVGALADVSRTPIQFIDVARFDPILFHIQHRDRKELNFRLRYYFEFDALVHNAICLHSEFPLSAFILECGDSKIQQFYNDHGEDIGLLQLLIDIGREFWMLGEAIPHGQWNDFEKKWSYFMLFPPENVQFKATYILPEPLMFLDVDDELKRIVKSGSAVDEALKKMMSPELVAKIESDKQILLSPATTSHIARKVARYDLRGTSIIKACLKDLMYMDKLRLLQFTICDRHMFPLKIFKLGNPQSVEGNHHIFLKKENNTNVLTFDDAWRQYSGKIKKFEGGTEVRDVLSHNLYTMSLDKEGNQKWVRVTDILRHPTPKDMVEVKTPVSTTRATTAHGFLWLNPSTLEFEKVSPEQLRGRENPAVVSVDKLDFTIDSANWDGIKLTPDLAYFLGLWTADGCLGGLKYKGVSIFNTNPGIVSRMKQLERLDCVDYIKTVQGYSPGSAKVWYHSPKLKNALVKLYEGHKIKLNNYNKTGVESFPQEILFNKRDTIVGSMLAGQIDGDGSVSSESLEVVISRSCSLKLMHQLSLSLLTRGITSRVVECKRGEKSTRALYMIIVSGKKNLEELYNLVHLYLAHSEKIKQFDSLIAKVKDRSYRDQFRNVYDVDNNVKDELFDHKTLGSLGLVRLDRTRMSAQVVAEKGVSEEVKDRLLKHTCVSVRSIEDVVGESEYVYDLILEEEPHTYLVAGKGWLPVHNTGWIPSRKHFDTLRELLIAQANDPDFNIIWHHGLQVEIIGTKDKIWNLIPEFDWVEKRILTALFTNEAITHGSGPTYSNASVAMRAMMHRYLLMRDQLSTWMRDKIWKPIATAREYYKTDSTNSAPEHIRKQGKYYALDLPRPKWKKLNLLDNQSQQQYMMTLRDKMQLDHKTLMEMFDFDPAVIVQRLKEEEGKIIDPAYIKARATMSGKDEGAEQILKGAKGSEMEVAKVEKPRKGLPGVEEEGGLGEAAIPGGPAVKPPTGPGPGPGGLPVQPEERAPGE